MNYDERPRKVHLFHDWEGAPYDGGIKPRPYANTLCKGNFAAEGLLTTNVVGDVTCQSCLKKMRLANVRTGRMVMKTRAASPLALIEHLIAGSSDWKITVEVDGQRVTVRPK